MAGETLSWQTRYLAAACMPTRFCGIDRAHDGAIREVQEQTPNGT